MAQRLVLGVGINDADYTVNPTVDGKSTICPYYKVWCNLLERCYSINLQKKYPTYKGCSVFPAWLYFSKFKVWMELQDWKGKQLDKDILYPGNKLYSPNTCIFITGELNRLLLNSGGARGKYPVGVCKVNSKRVKRFMAQCMVDGKTVFLGYYLTPEEAAKIYREFKSNHVREVANDYKDNPKLYEGLHKHANLIEGVNNGYRT